MPSGGGKTHLLVNLFTDKEAWLNAFERIYVFSPSVHLDKTYELIKNMQAKKAIDPNEQLYFPEWDEGALQTIIQRQAKITQRQKERGMKRLFGIAVILDDFADDPKISRSKVLQTLFVRGRRFMITTVCSVQRYNVVSPIVRCNATDLLVGHLRNATDFEAISDENSIITPHGRRGFRALYDYATQERYSFLNIKLSEPDKYKTFWLRFDTPLEIEDEVKEPIHIVNAER